MADFHKEFTTFHGQIALTYRKKEYLRKSRDVIRDRIRKYFRDNLKVALPKFHGQGSYAMGTIINPLDDEFDIDDGVYLQHLDKNDDSEWPTPETVHRWLVNATDGHTKEKPIDKRTCVRVQYAGQYHIDLPIYAKLYNDFLLAEKGAKGWHRSDPKALTEWFIENVKQHGEQLRRIVRYLKAWANFQSGRRGKMPSGLILTVLAARNFLPNERDDVSFADTACAISSAVNFVFCVYNPVDSYEDLTARLTDEQKARFQEVISELASDAAIAVDADDREEAYKLWKRQLGDRFPAVEKDDNAKQKKEDAGKIAAFYATKNPPKPWGHL